MGGCLESAATSGARCITVGCCRPFGTGTAFQPFRGYKSAQRWALDSFRGLCVMKLCAIALIISCSLLSGCNFARTVINASQHETAAGAPVRIQEIAPRNSISAEPTGSKKERALKELLSEDVAYQQAHALNTNDPKYLFVLYTAKIINNWTPPQGIAPETPLVLDVQMSAYGTISLIEIAQASGEYQFDHSAILAIRSIGVFSEVKGLGEVDYNKYFKFHKIKFSPIVRSSN